MRNRYWSTDVVASDLMSQGDRIGATGGAAMLTSAYSSGTPALGVGVDNAVITVDDTADLDDAAEKIRISKTLDLAASCSSENSVILVGPIYDAMLDKLQAQGGYVVTPQEKTKLQNTTWTNGHLSTAIADPTADQIIVMTGIDPPDDTTY